MFNNTSARLVAWAAEVVGEPIASLTPPLSQSEGGRRIGIHLLDLLPHPTPHGERRQRLHVTLRYLATVSAETPADAHRLLGDLTFAAMQHPDIEVDREPPPLTLWQALNIAPQPSIVVRCQAWKDLPMPRTPLVTKSTFTMTPAVPVSGRITTKGGRPVNGATVRIAEYKLRARTDASGAFEFPAVPSGASVAIDVEASGQSKRVDVVVTETRRTGLAIQLDQSEP